MSQRARRDLQTAVSFLTTRVKKPDEDDWGKLRRVMQYLYGTLYMKLTLTVDNMSVIHWWVDASHMTHMDCRGHTGGMMSLGKGAALSYSGKQKLNTKSSTESELVGADDMLVKILWARYFLEAQGYSIEQNIMFQDNMATMQLEVNGTLSSSKRTKHIKARYFFIKDKIESGEVSVEYCPTEMMWADVLNKPKSGRPFRLDRSYLMNVPVDFDNTAELLRTHDDLLPREDRLYKAAILSRQRHHRAQSRHRSVLGKNKSCQASSPRTKSYADAVRAPSQGSRRGSRLPRQ